MSWVGQVANLKVLFVTNITGFVENREEQHKIALSGSAIVQPLLIPMDKGLSLKAIPALKTIFETKNDCQDGIAKVNKSTH